jgi:transposase
MRRLLWQPWTKAEVAHLGRLISKGYSMTAAARRLGRSFSSTYEKAYEHGFVVQKATGRGRPRVSKSTESTFAGG